MEKILIISLMILATAPALSVQQTWTPVSQEQAEYDLIKMEIAILTEFFEGYTSSRCYKAMGVELLQKIGTPVSYKIYKEMLASRQL